MPLFGFDITKNDIGVIRTKSLFYELSYADPSHAVFTMKETDTETSEGRPLVSFSKTFIELTVDDPTEVTFADTVFGSWAVWDKIRNADKRIVANIESSRHEATIRRKSLALRTIVKEVESQGRGAMSAAKYLLEEPWVVAKDGRKKRASALETAKEAFDREGLSEDIKRLEEGGLLQ